MFRWSLRLWPILMIIVIVVVVVVVVVVVIVRRSGGLCSLNRATRQGHNTDVVGQAGGGAVQFLQ